MINFLNSSHEKPYILFQSLYQKAIENGQKGVEAISVSSYNEPLKEVEARYVNLKYIDNNEWIFFSNYLSPKAISLSLMTKFPFLFIGQALILKLE